MGDNRKLAPWRLIGTSVQGRSHRSTGTRCQDALRYIVSGDFAIAAISDGAGSAELAHLGSSIAAETAISVLISAAQEHRKPTLGDLQEAFVTAREAIGSDATERDRFPSDYACTLLLTVAGPEYTLVGQIGDGAIVGLASNGELRPLTWPQQGEYANATVFLVQQDINPILSEDEPLQAFSLFSDGLQNVALEYSTRAAYAPFFIPFFEALKPQDISLDELNIHLTKYLENDAQLALRTDDDLSLLVGIRT